MVNDRQNLDLSAFSRAPDAAAVEWLISDQAIPYPEAIESMEARVADIAAGHAPELVWLLEHPSLYTSGTGGKAADLLDPRFPIFDSGRGGPENQPQMARITVEDCLENIPNRFELVLGAARRAKQLLKGARPLVESDNKEVVTALREIAAGKVTIEEPDA